jgi:hypothetical protein
MCGNEALAEAAVRAGCDAYFGYPITPQNEITAYMSRRMAEEGRVFVQSESELAAINMVFGASATAKRAMTSSSSPGISLMQEGISYLAGAELPGISPRRRAITSRPPAAAGTAITKPSYWALRACRSWPIPCRWRSIWPISTACRCWFWPTAFWAR